MAHGLLDLPPELIDSIYKLCRKSDLVNVSCCSKLCYESVKYLLWNILEIPLWFLAQESFDYINLENFKFTSVLRFRSHGYKTLQKVNWNSTHTNYKNILEHCDNKHLIVLEIDGLINDLGVIMTCNMLTNLQEVLLNNCKDITDTGWLHLGALPHLKKLWLTACCIHDSGVEKLVESGHLVEFKLIKCSKITDKCLKHINGLIRLMNIKINNCESIFADRLKYLDNIPTITDIDLEDSRITDQAMVYLSLLKSLKFLVVDGYNNNVTDVGLFYLSKLTSLETLGIINCVDVMDYGLSHLTSLTCLKDLDISGCGKVKDIGLFHISFLTSLNHLDVSYCKMISDTGLQHIAKLTLLKKLNVAHCSQITDEGLTNIGKLLLLNDLDISNCICVTDTGIYQLSKLSSLSNLIISGCNKVTDVGISHLSGLPLLSRLDVSHCSQISDISIFHISRLKSLESLNIHNCSNVTDGSKWVYPVN